MKIEQRRYTDGSVEVEIARDDGEVVAALRVRPDRENFSTDIYVVESRVRKERADEPREEEGPRTYRVRNSVAVLHRPERRPVPS